MGAKRGYGTGQLHEKHGAYYGRWRTSDGRRLNRRLGPSAKSSNGDGLTRAEAERVFRSATGPRGEAAPPGRRSPPRVTVDHAADDLAPPARAPGLAQVLPRGLRSRCSASTSRPRLGDRPLAKVTTADVEDARRRRCSPRASSPRPSATSSPSCTQVFEHAIDRGWTNDNPVRRASAPAPPARGDTEPDLQFLTLAELEAVLRAIPDEVVVRAAGADARAAVADRRRLRRPTSSGPVAARPHPHRRDDRSAPVRAARPALARRRLGRRSASAFATPTCAASTPPTASPTSPPAARCRWPTASPPLSTAGRQRTIYTGDDDLVFAHPQTGKPLDGSKVTRSASKDACRAAGVRPIRFHDLRHTFATRLAASGKVSLRTIQEFLGHADAKTTQIYAHYAPSDARGRDGQRRFRCRTRRGQGQ